MRGERGFAQTAAARVILSDLKPIWLFAEQNGHLVDAGLHLRPRMPTGAPHNDKPTSPPPSAKRRLGA